ncbi:MAG: hypothetical protein AAFR14_13175, partial [Bacteroidota bacterium]
MTAELDATIAIGSSRIDLLNGITLESVSVNRSDDVILSAEEVAIAPRGSVISLLFSGARFNSIRAEGVTGYHWVDLNGDNSNWTGLIPSRSDTITTASETTQIDLKHLYLKDFTFLSGSPGQDTSKFHFDVLDLGIKQLIVGDTTSIKLSRLILAHPEVVLLDTNMTVAADSTDSNLQEGSRPANKRASYPQFTIDDFGITNGAIVLVNEEEVSRYEDIDVLLHDLNFRSSSEWYLAIEDISVDTKFGRIRHMSSPALSSTKDQISARAVRINYNDAFLEFDGSVLHPYDLSDWKDIEAEIII